MLRPQKCFFFTPTCSKIPKPAMAPAPGERLPPSGRSARARAPFPQARDSPALVKRFSHTHPGKESALNSPQVLVNVDQERVLQHVLGLLRDVPQVAGDEEGRCQDRPQRRLDLQLLVAQAKVADNQLEGDRMPGGLTQPIGKRNQRKPTLGSCRPRKRSCFRTAELGTESRISSCAFSSPLRLFPSPLLPTDSWGPPGVAIRPRTLPWAQGLGRR